MAFERACRSKFAEFMSHHVLCDKDCLKDFPVVDTERVTHELRSNGRSSGPRLDGLLLFAQIHTIYVLQHMSVNKGPFFNGSSHNALKLLLFHRPTVSSHRNKAIRCLVFVAGSITLRQQPPRGGQVLAPATTL